MEEHRFILLEKKSRRENIWISESGNKTIQKTEEQETKSFERFF